MQERINNFRHLIIGLIMVSPVLFIAAFVLFLFTIPWILDFHEIVELNRARIPDFHRLSPAEDLPFSQSRYMIARYIAVILGGGTIIGLVWSLRRRSDVLNGLRRFGILAEEEIRNSRMALKGMPRSMKWATIGMLALSVSMRVWQNEFILIHNDELATYNYFVVYGWPMTMAYYPMPNNHVFFNILFVASSSLISDHVLAGRIISLISFYGAVFILYTGIIRISGSYWNGFIALLLVLFLMPPSIYSVIGRGYMLTILLGMIGWWSLQKGLKTKASIYFVIFVIAGTMGCYTLPVFILVLVPMIMYVVWASVRQQVLRKKIWSIMAGFILGNILCYLPIIIFNGPKALFANKDINRVIEHDFTRVYQVHVAEFFSYLTTVPSKGWVIMVVFLGMILWVFQKLNTGEKQFIAVSALVVSMFLLFPLVFQISFPTRVFTILTFFWYGSVAILLGTVLRQLPLKFSWSLFGFLLLLIAHQAWYQHQNDPFTYILPSESQRVLHNHLVDCTDNAGVVYFDSSSEFIHMYVYYMEEFKGLLVTDDPEKATFLIIENEAVQKYDYPRYLQMHEHVIIKKQTAFP